MAMNKSPRGRSAERAEASEDLAHLSLLELREYRRTLTDEEERISYWRRLVHARLDLLTAAQRGVELLTETELVKALGETGTGARRRALMRLRAETDPVPELPGLTSLWRTAVNLDDPESQAEVVADLQDAERKLTAYRMLLHERLAEATGELIVRYIEEPAACLDLLPD